jgi:ribose transport system permease protein
VALAALLLVCACVAPGTLDGKSIESMLPFAAVLSLVAVGHTLVIQQAGIDLSTAGVMSMTAVIVTQHPAGDSGRLVEGIALALCAAALAGLVNGLVIAKLDVSPIVATLGANALLLGVVRSYSGGVPTAATKSLSNFALDKTMGISNTVVVAAIFTALTALVMTRTVLGRSFIASGIGPAAARAAGLRTDGYIIGAYVASAICYATAATLLAGYVQSPSISTGDPYMLAPIAAVVIGGSSLGRGRTSVVASVGGALFLSQLTQLILGLGAPTAVQLLVQAAAIGVAVGARRWHPFAVIRHRRATNDTKRRLLP